MDEFVLDVVDDDTIRFPFRFQEQIIVAIDSILFDCPFCCLSDSCSQ